MPTIMLGNASVVEEVKKDEALDASPYHVERVHRKDLGKRVTTMVLNETDIDDRPSRGMNLTMAVQLWARHSDKPPDWVEGDDELLAQLVADHYGCSVGRSKSWKEG